MGSSESKPPPPKQIPTVTPPAIPTRQTTDVSVSTSSACLECTSESCKDGKPCRLAVAPNKSAASVKIFRNRKVVDARTGQCGSLWNDFFNIGKTVTLQEFAVNLQAGKYSTASPQGGCVDVTVNPTQYGTLLKLGDNFNPNDKANQDIVKNNTTSVRTREVKNSFLSENKLTIVPNVPFEMSYNGKVFNVTKMALFHPSPVRIENVQHDAIITLNDPIDNPEFVVMIPLVASSFVTESTTFFSRIGSAFSKVVIPTQEGEETVATGSDWSISKLFDTMSDGISVTDSFYTWTGVAENVKTGRYILIEKPKFISAGELTELRNIPPADSKFAIPSIADPVSYRKALCCKAEKTKSTTVRETFISRNTTPKEMIQWFFAIVFFVAGVATAMMLVLEYPVAESIRNGVIMIGKFLSDQFDKLYKGPSIPGLGDLSDIKNALNEPGGLDLKNLSSPGNVSSLENLASKVASAPAPAPAP